MAAMPKSFGELLFERFQFGGGSSAESFWLFFWNQTPTNFNAPQNEGLLAAVSDHASAAMPASGH
jgi:hypothetical protein